MDDRQKQIQQIETLADDILQEYTRYYSEVDKKVLAEMIYNAGYREQSVGEWERIEVKGKNYAHVYYQHTDCEVNETQIFPSPYNFCPNCGAMMKGGKTND